MSEETKVETLPVETEADDKGTEAIWAELTQAKADTGDIPPAKAAEPEPKTEETPKVEAPATADSPAKDDPWKDAPPELREAHQRDLEAIRTRAEQAETLARRHSGRLVQLNSQLADLQARIAPQRDDSAAAAEEAKTSEERKKQLREEYPDLATPILDQVEALQAEIAEIKGAQSREVEAQTNDLIAEQTEIVNRAHPDWQTAIQDNPKFIEWAGQQSPHDIDLIVRNSGRPITEGASVASIISRFKRETADPEKERAEARRQEQLEAARAADVRNPGLATPKGEGTIEQTWDDLNQERRRKAEGNRR